MRTTENPLEAIEEMMAFNSRDWAQDKSDAWLWAVVLGWGPDDGGDEDCWDLVAPQHGWTAEDVKRLKRLNERWKQLVDLCDALIAEDRAS